MFGVLDLDTGMHGCRFSIGIRNAHDKSMRLAMTVGYRVFVCENMAFSGDFQPVLAKHSKHFSLQNALSIGVDQMQRNFDGMRKQVEAWRESQLSDVAAKLIIYRAFIESDLEVPKHLARPVHDLYFTPQHEEFQPRTLWSLSNAFTSAFKELEPIPQFKATAKLAGFLERVDEDMPGFRWAKSWPRRGRLKLWTEAGESPATFLKRHVTGDWGEVDEEDRQRKRALGCGQLPAPLGVQPFERHEALDHHRGRPQRTTLLLPSEY